MNVLSRTVANNNAAVVAALEQEEKHWASESPLSCDSLDFAGDGGGHAQSGAGAAPAGAAPAGAAGLAGLAATAASAAPIPLQPVFRTSLSDMLEAAFQMMDPNDSGYVTAASFDVSTAFGTNNTNGEGSASGGKAAGVVSGTDASMPADPAASNDIALSTTSAEQKLHQHIDEYIYDMLESLELSELHSELSALKAVLPEEVPAHIA